MEMMKWVARLIIVLCMLGLFIGLWNVFGLLGLIVAVVLGLFAVIYHQQRKLEKMIKKLDEKIENMKG